ncbi:MAG: S8 family serine peptidase [Bacteroidota bacterium]|nr:S8 family serine peptidase [Bacteroidota bacterium]
MKKSIIIVIIAFLPVFIFSQAFKAGKISPFTAHFLTTTNGKTTDSTAIEKLQNRFLIKKISSQSYVNAFILLNDNADLDVLRANGVKINTVLPNIITAQVPVQDLENIALLPEVKNLQIAIPVHRKMDKARIATNVDKVQAGTNLSLPFLGKHVVIGIIDSGIEYRHINFFDSTGTTLRIKHVWDQNITGTPPSGFSYGNEYTTQASILAAKFDNQTETHGTHVTGIAAGADKSNNNIYYGVAPDADIALVSYNLNDQTTDNVSILDGIKYIYDYATSVNEPCVINMSLGTHIGPHDGTSLFDQTCDAQQGKGRLLVGAAGNEGSDSLHVSQTFTPVNTTLKTFFTYYKDTQLIGYTDIWGDANKNFSIRVVVYNKNTGKEIYSTPSLNAATSDSRSDTLAATNGAVGTIQIYTERNQSNNKPNAFVVSDMNSINSGNYIGIIITAQDGTVHAWADDNYSYFTGNNLNGWTVGNSNNSMGEIGGTGKQIISAGAFVSKTSFTNTLRQTLKNTYETLNHIASFSSKGPTIDGRTKPDIAAPGSLVVSSYSSAIIKDPNYSSDLVKVSNVNGNSYYYGILQGTSMASPMVTGILATWLEAKNDLSPDEVRTVFKQTAISDTFTGTIPSNGSDTWGFGKIDAWNGIIACLKLEVLQKIEASNENYIIYPNPATGTFSVLFGRKDSNVQLTVYSLNGRKVFSKQVGTVSAAQELDINLSNLATGAYLVTLSGNLQYKTYHLLKR